jgi:hypothetical protein
VFKRAGFRASILSVRNLLVMILLVFLPFQFTWAAAAGYCQHETDAPLHLGHHAHPHQADDDPQKDKKPVGVEGDCVACHAGCAAALTRAQPFLPVALAASSLPWPPRLAASPPGKRPERPQWTASA